MAIVLQLGKTHPALSPLGTAGNALWGPPLRTNSRPFGVASSLKLLAPIGTESREGQGTVTEPLHQAPSLSCGGLVGVWGPETPISESRSGLLVPCAPAGWVGDTGG